MRRSVVSLVALFALAQSAAAQRASSTTDTVVARIPRWQAGAAVEVGQPVGAFKRNVKNAAGGQGHVLLRLDGQGTALLRLEGGWLNYGQASQRSCLGTAPQCRVSVDLTTANGILSLAIGPQLSVPLGRVRLYGYGLVGMSRFATVSGLGGGLLPDVVGAAENYGDGGAVLRGSLGLQIPVHRSTSLDIGFGYESHGERTYLLENGLTDKPDGSLGFDFKRSRADLFGFRIGLTRALGMRHRTPAEGR